MISGEENIGTRRWGQVEGLFDCTYSAKVRVDRTVSDLASLNICPLHGLPADVTKFLMPSRYCHPEAFLAFVPEQFGSTSGGRLIADMAHWIAENFTYDNEASNGLTNATDSFQARRGVCRDYAHVLIAMARSVGIPARMASVYAPNVVPQDVHAVAEVYLDGNWHLVDPTAMADPTEIVRIGVGRDAADVSFMTSYGWMELIEQSVDVTRLS
jgi:transglutaminase-like putative cysteine protease